MEKVYVVTINGVEKYRFSTMDKACEFQEYCVFVLGLDAEVL